MAYKNIVENSKEYHRFNFGGYKMPKEVKELLIKHKFEHRGFAGWYKEKTDKDDEEEIKKIYDQALVMLRKVGFNAHKKPKEKNPEPKKEDNDIKPNPEPSTNHTPPQSIPATNGRSPINPDLLYMHTSQDYLLLSIRGIHLEQPLLVTNIDNHSDTFKVKDIQDGKIKKENILKIENKGVVLYSVELHRNSIKKAYKEGLNVEWKVIRGYPDIRDAIEKDEAKGGRNKLLLIFDFNEIKELVYECNKQDNVKDFIEETNRWGEESGYKNIIGAGKEELQGWLYCKLKQKYSEEVMEHIYPKVLQVELTKEQFWHEARKIHNQEIIKAGFDLDNLFKNKKT